MIKQIFKFFALMILAGAVLAAPVGPDSAVMKMLAAKGYTIGKSFDAGHGLTGWVVTHGAQPTVVFVTADGKSLVIGAMLDDKGANLTQGFMDRYAVDPALAKAYDAFGTSLFVAQKPPLPTKRIVYIVFDANCPYCSLAYKGLQKYVATGVELRWLPVAYLKADSANRAAAILGAADPAAALAENETGFNQATHQGGIAPVQQVPASMVQGMQNNDRIMQTLNSTATPTFLWKDDTGAVHEALGLPSIDVMLDMVGVSQPR